MVSALLAHPPKDGPASASARCGTSSPRLAAAGIALTPAHLLQLQWRVLLLQVNSRGYGVWNARHFLNSAIEASGCLPCLRRPPAPAAGALAPFMRRAEVEAKTGFKRAPIYNDEGAKFPKGHARLGVRAVGWDSVEIEQWIADRRKRSRLTRLLPSRH